jgi:hypothetical protein
MEIGILVSKFSLKHFQHKDVYTNLIIPAKQQIIPAGILIVS